MDPAQTEGKESGTYRMRNHRWTLPRQRGRGGGEWYIQNEEPQMDPAQTERKVSGTYRMKNHRWILPRQRGRRVVHAE
ncbi:hypothetical protein XELAEV_18046165mg [Xenopus laevis]|uniref:Uncharacterized protein n=1 Tax=Xenopus laevis TaxID=8355 RepID=A0A974BT23_XENLA|nr:hypothetical protein XELAEV_18046165mg [Xenopus laevis]